MIKCDAVRARDFQSMVPAGGVQKRISGSAQIQTGLKK